MTDRYAVFGNPIAQSKSPLIHGLFAEQFQLDMSYQAQHVDVDGFAKAANAFFQAEGSRGLNITSPFKQDAFAFSACQTERARRAGAVNTLALQEDGSVLGDTTDGVGLVLDLMVNLQWQLAGKNILVLGAGGAVSGVLEALLAQNPAKLVIANRTKSKAVALAEAFADLGATQAESFEDLGSEPFDIIINGTSAGLSGDEFHMPDGIVSKTSQCYDMTYGIAPTAFQRWAKQRCEQVVDGVGMLVGQAAASFEIWTGQQPDTAPVIQVLRKNIAASLGTL